MKNVILDFDGTILNIEEKYKYVFGIITGLGSNSQEIFWEYRKLGIKSTEVLKLFPEVEFSGDEFNDKWKEIIESKDALELDIVSPANYEALDLIAGKAKLTLCTARQNKSLLLQQLQYLDLDGFFSSVLVTEQVRSKYDLIRQDVLQKSLVLNQKDWMVGDTLEDVLTGQELGIMTCGVLSGLTPESIFLNLEPFPSTVLADLRAFSLFFE
jgi:phosphoglycolate phosphatase-like HAD superfamily hydrolase